jgi:hypothetical protein
MLWKSEDLRKEDQIRADIARYKKMIEKKSVMLSKLYEKVYKYNEIKK